MVCSFRDKDFRCVSAVFSTAFHKGSMKLREAYVFHNEIILIEVGDGEKLNIVFVAPIQFFPLLRILDDSLFEPNKS